jgi:phosphate:Na+ symporter
MATFVLLDLMGGVALLLWGLHMVRSGILRAFGADLRYVLSKALANRFAAFGAGLGLTALLQSSTATALMTASFASEGMVELVPALAIMLGANVGTTLIVQVLSFNVTLAAPFLFIAGVVAFQSGAGARIKNMGRMAIGFGLMLLALHTLIDTLAPAENAPTVKVLLAAIADQPVLCIIIAAALTWAAHSSVAIVLLVMSLAYSQFIGPAATIAFVLGANLGTAINPLIEAARRDDPASYRLPLGNLLNRLVGVALAVLLLRPIATAMAALQPNPAKMAAEFHIFFNVALALAFIGLLDPIAAALQWALPARSAAQDAATPRYLDDSAIDTPSLALANAARETLRMSDIVETMLQQIMTALITDNRSLVNEVSRMDNVVDRLHEAVKLYVTKVTRGSLEESEGRRAMEIISYAINLEHVGDIIDRNLCEVAAKKIKRRLKFSGDGAAELIAFHKRVVDSFKIACVVFMSADVAQARKLIADKADLRAAEIAAAERHFERLREGRPETVQTTSLHLDILRDLKRIHSHICSVAYSVLETAGQMKAADVVESDPIVIMPPAPSGGGR